MRLALPLLPPTAPPFYYCLQGPNMAELLAPHARLQAWLQRLRQECAPHYEGRHLMPQGFGAFAYRGRRWWSCCAFVSEAAALGDWQLRTAGGLPPELLRHSQAATLGAVPPARGGCALMSTSTACPLPPVPLPSPLRCLSAEVHVLLRKSRDRLVARKQQQASKL